MTYRSIGTLVRVLILAAILCAPLGAAAQSSGKKPAYIPPIDELYKRFRPAIAKIVVKQHGIPVITGAGFLISEDGFLVTNQHVMRNAVLSSASFTAELTLGDGRVFKKFDVANCGDQRGLDICLLKLDVRPKVFFNLASESRPMAGEAVYAFGHPRGHDFSITKGVVSTVRQTQTRIEEIQFSGPIAPGDSGAPLLDDKGTVVGVVNRYSSDRAQLNTAIAAIEVADYQGSNTAFMGLKEGRNMIVERTRSAMRSLAATDLAPALAVAMKDRNLNGVKNIRELAFDFDDLVMKLDLPSVFDNCAKSRKPQGDVVLQACFAWGDAAAFSIQRAPIKPGQASLKTKTGKVLLEAKPTEILRTLMHEGQWAELQKKLTPEQKKSFYSRAQPAECGTMRASTLPGAMFGSVPYCRFTVQNDDETGAESVNLWLEKDGFVYSLSAWAADPGLMPFFGQLPTLASLTARTGKTQATAAPRAVASTLTDRRLSSYNLPLPGSIGFMGAKPLKGGLQYDLYGKWRGADSFEESYVLAVTGRRRAVLPPEFETFLRSMTTAAAGDLRFKIDEKSIDFVPTTIGEKPARIMTATGKTVTGETAAIFVCGIFDKERVFVVTEVTPSTDVADGFQKFKNLVNSFQIK